MIGLDCVDAVSVTSADIRDLTRLTQEVEVSTGLGFAAVEGHGIAARSARQSR